MKLRDLYRINSRRGLLLSILFHSLILMGIATLTIQLTTPEGFVSYGEIDLSDGGKAIPVDIAPSVPKGKVDSLEEAKIEDVSPKESQTTPIPSPETIENQDVDAPIAKETVTEKKGWIPVEDTDIDDSAGGSTKGEDHEGETNGEEAAGIEDGDEREASGGEEDAGPVRSEKELRGLPENKMSYPLMARIQRVEGTVVLRFTLKPTGEVEKVWVHQSSGSRLLDSHAQETHSKWKYEQGLEGVFQKKVVFSLKGTTEQLPYR